MTEEWVGEDGPTVDGYPSPLPAADRIDEHPGLREAFEAFNPAGLASVSEEWTCPHCGMVALFVLRTRG